MNADELMAKARSGELLKDLVSETKLLAQPIDFAALERKGILSQAGRWYLLHKPHELPAHAAKKISVVATDSKRGTKVKFYKASKFEKVAKRFERMAVKVAKKSSGTGGRFGG